MVDTISEILGPEIEVVVLIKAHVLQRTCADHLKVRNQGLLIH